MPELSERTFSARVTKPRVVGEDPPRHTLGDGAPATQTRWLCAQISGEEILDLGCGDGLLAVLLAREGHTVTAVDWDLNRLFQAEALAAAEAPPSGDRLQVLSAEPWFLPVDDDSFSTVLVREALEGRLDATPIFQEVARVLRGQGTAALALRYPPASDADATPVMTLAKLEQAASARFHLRSIEVGDGWIGLELGLRPRALKQSHAWREALAALEDRALAAGRELAANSKAASDLGASLEQAEQKLAAVTKERDDLAGEVGELRAQVHRQGDLRASVGQLTARSRELERGLAERDRHLEQAQVELDQRSQALSAAQSEAGRAQEQQAALDERVGELQGELAERERELERLRSELESDRNSLSEAQAEAERGREQALRHRGRIDELAATVERLGAQLAIGDDLAAELEERTAELQEEADQGRRLRERLEALQSSRSYRVMRTTWKVRRGLRRLAFWRRKRSASEGDAGERS